MKIVRKRIKRLAQTAAESMGYAVIPHWRLQNFDFAEHLKHLFELLSVDCVLDVGANKGQYRDFLRLHVGYQGAIVSFEPVPENVEVLIDHARADQHWNIMPLALGGDDRTAKIKVTRATEFSSFLTPNEAMLPEIAGLSEVQRSEVVPVKRLDSIFDQVTGPRRSRNIFLKIDAQGYEIDILKGAEHSLQSIRGLQAETSVIPLYHGGRGYLECIAYMQELGFHLTGVFTVNRDHLLRVIDFDVVMRRLEAQ